MLTGQLAYQGENQGRPFYAETEDGLRTVAAFRLGEIKQECGDAFDATYPLQRGWWLKLVV